MCVHYASDLFGFMESIVGSSENKERREGCFLAGAGPPKKLKKILTISGYKKSQTYFCILSFRQTAVQEGAAVR